MQVNVGKVYHTMCQKVAAVAYEKWSFNSREVPAIVLGLGFFVFSLEDVASYDMC